MKKIILTALFVLALASISYSGIFKKRFVLFEEAGRSAVTAPVSTGDAVLWDATGDAVLWDASGDKVLWD